MNRYEFQKLADARLEDAEALLEGRRFDAAYYMAGYAVEACICRKTREFDFPPKDAARLYQHDLEALLAAAGLTRVALDLKTNTVLAGNWVIVKDWNEQSRYRLLRDAEVRARRLVSAVGGEQGVLKWLSKYW